MFEYWENKIMRLVFKLFLCLYLLPLSVFCQERIQKVVVGPYNGQIRLLISFANTTEDGFGMQSMIIDLDSIKDGKEQPKSVTVDLTSTVRSLVTGKKDQKILLIRWNKKEEIEMKCEGKWTKKDSDSASQKIIETTKTIIQNIPLNKKEPTEITLPEEIVQKVDAVLDSMKTENFSCLRIVN
jgi:hypothetical protein